MNPISPILAIALLLPFAPASPPPPGDHSPLQRKQTPTSAPTPGDSPRHQASAASPIAAAGPGSIRYVDASVDGADDGSSWADAYNFLQDALNEAAGAGGTITEIRVAAGTYRPDQGGDQTPGDRSATFQLLNGVAIYGGFAGTETAVEQRDVDLNETILSGDVDGDDSPVACVDDSPDCDSFGGSCVDGLCIIADNNAENAYHVVTGSGTDTTAILDGFTITAGFADTEFPEDSGAGMYNATGSPTLTNCTFSGNSASGLGGGMLNSDNSSPTLTNCTFSGNSADFGGGGMFNGSSSPTLTNCTFNGNSATFSGGGMYNGSSSPTVTNCTFSGNSASNGGGMFNGSSSPTVTNCTFSGNSASNVGGGMYNDTGSPTLTNCTFSGNSAGDGGSGGGMFNDSGSPTVTNCTFSGNSASNGGGMYNIGSSSPTVTNCTFTGNSADLGGGGGMVNDSTSSPTLTNCTFTGNSALSGGGMLNLVSSSPTLTNCSFSGNSAIFGGGMYNFFANPSVTNCTFRGNSATTGGGMYNDTTSSPTLTNCILWNNSDSGGTDESAQIHTVDGTPTVNYSIIQGGWTGAGGTGNLATDPLFIDPDGPDNIIGTEDDDLRLSPGSPAIDAADNSAVPADTADLDGDLDTLEPTPLDLDLNERFVDDPNVPDTGNGTAPIVDIGAFEFQAEVVFVDDFDDGALDPLWSVTFDGNADGWTFAEGGTELSVTDIATITTFCDDECAAWGNVQLKRFVASLNDFHVDFDFTWSSLDVFDAMQNVTLHLLGPGDVVFALVGYADAWGPNGNALGRQSAKIGGTVFSGPNDLPHAGTASVDIDRVGSAVSIRWNGDILLTGTTSTPLESVRIEFSHFDEVGADGGGVDCGSGCNLPANHPPSTFGVEAVDLIGIQNVAQTVRYVRADATGLNNGSSWADAYLFLQDALDEAAGAGGTITEIWVAAGTYRPDQGGGQTPGDRFATFQLLDGVAIYGGFAGTETAVEQHDVDLNETILSGDVDGDDAPVACTVDSPDCDSFGGLCVDGFCIISDNNDENSYHVVTGSGTDATAVIDGFTVTAGFADGTDPENRGAGMYNVAGSPTLTNCTFTANSADFGGGGMYNQSSSSPTLTNCTFTANSAGSGGGVLNISSSSPTLTICTFTGNTASSGGGMFNGNSSPALTNCTFSGNSASTGGGGMLNISSSSPTLTNCTLIGNSANGEGGGMFNSDASPTLTNCTLWNNSDSGGTDESAQIHTNSGTPTVNYSIVQGGWTGAEGTGNLASNPLFIDADGPDNIAGTEDDDLRLSPGSPAIDAGDNSAVPADTADLDGDLDTLEPTPLDLLGFPRFVDDLFTADTGSGTPPIVDMGAVEFFQDCNGNGQPDVCDLACAALAGDCGNFSQCGLSTDCNENGTLDSCEIEECSGDLACNDCNLNGLPDECDDPIDNMPDECVEASAGGDWTDDVWGLGGQYPDTDDSVPNQSVTLDGTSIFLDETVTIDSLILQNGAVLSVTQAGVEGDLNVVSPGGILAKGLIEVSGDRVINVPAGPLRLGAGGAYQREDAAVGVTATLNAAGVTLTRGELSCSPTLVEGGTMVIDQSMGLNINGDLIVDGTGANSCLSTCGGRSARGGLIRPPRLKLENTLPTADSMTLIQSVEVTVEETGAITLTGDFNNLCTMPECFVFDGELILANAPSRAATAVGRTFETAGRDFGASAAGFVKNFQMGTITVNTGREVTFIDQATNISAAGSEALYVDTLHLQAGSSTTVENTTVYYIELIDESAGATLVGSGALLFAGACQLHGDVFPYDNTMPNGDTIGNCVVDLDDILTILAAFSALNQCDPAFPNSVNAFPCGQACELGVVDLDDILSVLAAFSGTFGCAHPMPPGACCMGDSSCQDGDGVPPGSTPSGGMSRGTCSQLGGAYQGDGTTCDDVLCP